MLSSLWQEPRGGRTDKSGTNRGCVTINLKAKTWVTPQQCCHGITTPGEGWVGPHRPCSVASQGCGGAQIAQPAPWSCPQLGPWGHPSPAVAPTQARPLHSWCPPPPVASLAVPTHPPSPTHVALGACLVGAVPARPMARAGQATLVLAHCCPNPPQATTSAALWCLSHPPLGALAPCGGIWPLVSRPLHHAIAGTQGSGVALWGSSGCHSTLGFCSGLLGLGGSL